MSELGRRKCDSTTGRRTVFRTSLSRASYTYISTHSSGRTRIRTWGVSESRIVRSFFYEVEPLPTNRQKEYCKITVISIQCLEEVENHLSASKEPRGVNSLVKKIFSRSLTGVSHALTVLSSYTYSGNALDLSVSLRLLLWIYSIRITGSEYIKISLVILHPPARCY